MGLYYKNVERAEAAGDNEVTFYFDVKNNRELPMIMGQLTILPKHCWDRDRCKRQSARPDEDHARAAARLRPLSHQDLRARRNSTYERVKDYWGKDIPVRSARRTSTRCASTITATRRWRSSAQGRQVRLPEREQREELGDVLRFSGRAQRIARSGGRACASQPMQAFAFNLRRPKFQDARVRHAFNLAFDFEGMNKKLFFGQYERVGSYFEGSELAAPPSCPEGTEKEILERSRTGCRPRCSPRCT